MECDNRFYLYTGHRFLCTISSTSVTIKKSPLSNFRIVSEQGRTKDLKTQNWQLYKSPERASAVSTNIWGDQPSRRSGLGFIMFGSEAWVPATSLCVWKSISCLLSLIPKICLSFLLLLLGSAPGESWVVWVDSAWHCTSLHLQRTANRMEQFAPSDIIFDFQHMYISRRGDTVGPPVWKSTILHIFSKSELSVLEAVVGRIMAQCVTCLNRPVLTLKI